MSMYRKLRATLKPARRVVTTSLQISRHPANRAQRLQSVKNFWSWRRQQKRAGSTVIPYIGNAVLVWPEAAGSVGKCAKFGLGEFADMLFTLTMLRPNDLFADVGANAGVYTVLASKVVGCKSVSAEPVPLTFSLLSKNIEANAIQDKVDRRQVGVGSKPDHLRFTAALWSFGHVAEDGDEDTVEVPVEPLDSILAGRVPTVIKIDVEGFEAEVVKGAASTLANPECKAVLIELAEDITRYGASGQDVIDTMTALGFEAYWYVPEHRHLVPAGRSGPGHWNKVFVRDLPFVQDRLRTAPPVEVRGQSF